jgi:hypothetical protein
LPAYLEKEKYDMGNRRIYNTALDAILIIQIQILAAQLEKRHNNLIEEAIQDLLNKYKYQNK